MQCLIIIGYISQNDRLELGQLSQNMRFEDVSVSKVLLQTQVPVSLLPLQPLLMWERHYTMSSWEQAPDGHVSSPMATDFTTCPLQVRHSDIVTWWYKCGLQCRHISLFQIEHVSLEFDAEQAYRERIVKIYEQHNPSKVYLVLRFPRCFVCWFVQPWGDSPLDGHHNSPWAKTLNEGNSPILGKTSLSIKTSCYPSALIPACCTRGMRLTPWWASTLVRNIRCI